MPQTNPEAVEPEPGEQTRTVLFLCTGNYFRSRLAEQLFDAYAAKAGLPWRGASRALTRQPQLACPGPLSPDAAQALRHRDLPVAADRRPLEATPYDLRTADLRVALNEREHRPMLAARFPEWEDQVEYWRCEDAHVAGAETVALVIESCVRQLVARLEEGVPASSRPRPSLPPLTRS